jgi:signal transduction histidine kinase
MRQRLREIGGRCEIHSEPGRGTQIVFSLPLTAAAK